MISRTLRGSKHFENRLFSSVDKSIRLACELSSLRILHPLREQLTRFRRDRTAAGPVAQFNDAQDFRLRAAGAF
jgi:hypothetical protein